MKYSGVIGEQENKMKWIIERERVLQDMLCPRP